VLLVIAGTGCVSGLNLLFWPIVCGCWPPLDLGCSVSFRCQCLVGSCLGNVVQYREGEWVGVNE
jgi:hypothetical protein